MFFTGAQYLQSYNYPDYKIGVNDDNEAYITLAGKLFHLVYPGLTGTSGSLSLRSVDQPDLYLRHYGYLLHLENRTSARNNQLFDQDASFWLREDVWFQDTVALESVNFPTYYIRHQGYRLKIATYDGSDLFKKDASFRSMCFAMLIFHSAAILHSTIMFCFFLYLNP